jgi:hypothetical protein
VYKKINLNGLDGEELGDDNPDNRFRHWYGDNEEKSCKGLAIFAPFHSVELISNFNNKFRYVIPYKIFSELDLLMGIKKETILLSIWTKAPTDGSSNYQKTIFDALDYYDFKKPIILAGDFNTLSNKNNLDRYEILKTNLEKRGLKNCAENTEFEFESTFFHDKTSEYFTNDFCFIPKNLNIREFYIDKMDYQKRWRGLSDHSPIIAEFDL